MPIVDNMPLEDNVDMTNDGGFETNPKELTVLYHSDHRFKGVTCDQKKPSVHKFIDCAGAVTNSASELANVLQALPLSELASKSHKGNLVYNGDYHMIQSRLCDGKKKVSGL